MEMYDDIGGNPGDQCTNTQSTIGSLGCSEISIGSSRIAFNALRTVRRDAAERCHSL